MITKLFIESLSNHTDGNTIDLYHYSNVDDDSLKLDPKQFGKNPWSKREKRSSATPKVFFYLDPEDKERYFKDKTPLYTVTVNANEIYDITIDKLGYIQKVKNDNNGVLNIDTLIEYIKKGGYKGMYYQLRFDVVAWFYPITVYRVPSYDTNTSS